MNIPSILTLYRLAAFPVATWAALEGYRQTFFVLITISLVTDLIDGPLARWWSQETRFGAKLDTIADGFTLLAGVLGVYIFEGHNIRPDVAWLYVFFVSYAAAAMSSLVKFGGLPAYHLYTSKAAAFSAAVFFIWIFQVEYSRPFFFVVVTLGTLANVESLLVTLRLTHHGTDIKSIFSDSDGTHSDET